MAGARAESGESGAEGDEGVPDENAGDAEADDAEADLGSDGGNEPELDVGMNASLGDAAGTWAARRRARAPARRTRRISTPPNSSSSSSSRNVNTRPT